jgi:hypothetical protein
MVEHLKNRSEDKADDQRGRDKRVKQEPRSSDDERQDDGLDFSDDAARKPKITIASFGLENRCHYEKKGDYEDVSEP